MEYGNCDSPAKRAYQDHTITYNVEISCSSPRWVALVGQQQHSTDHNLSEGSMFMGNGSETPFCPSLSAFHKLSLTPKTLPPDTSMTGTDNGKVVSCGKRTRSIFETPSPRVSHLGRLSTMPVPPPLKPIYKGESTEILDIDEFVHRIPLLGESSEPMKLRQQQDNKIEQDDTAFARRLKMKKTRDLALSPRCVGYGFSL